MQSLKKNYPNKKEILIIFTNNYSLVKMYKHYSQNKRKYNANFNVLVEYNTVFEKNIKKKLLTKFTSFWKVKNINFIKINFLPKIYIKNIFFFLNKIKLYRKNHIKNNEVTKKHFFNNIYDEIWLSNTNLKDYINFRNNTRIKLFSHAHTDEKIVKISFIQMLHLKCITYIVFLFTSIKINYLFHATKIFDNFSNKKNLNFIINLIQKKLNFAIPSLKNKPIVLIHYQFGFIKNYKLIKKINTKFAKFINEFKINNQIENFQFILKAKRDNDQKFTENLKNILEQKYKIEVKVFHKLENLPLSSEFYFKDLDVRYLLSIKSHTKLIFNKMYKNKSIWIDYTYEFLNILNYYYDHMDTNEKLITNNSNKIYKS